MEKMIEEQKRRLVESRRITASQQETIDEILNGVWAMLEEAQGGRK